MEFRNLLIGGLIPSFLLGLGTVLMKFSIKAGMSLPGYLVIVGFTISIYGTIFCYVSGNNGFPIHSIFFAIVMGVSWATAIFCMSYGLSVLKIPISIISPLTNTNALIAVILGALVFAEWKDLNMIKILIGTILIITGATIVSSAQT
ncbi:hypothetical protein P3G55_20625 [Leptospira sp. 96542]|nr:hypothetical protein [Leptospira sp. 96542]